MSLTRRSSIVGSKVVSYWRGSVAERISPPHIFLLSRTESMPTIRGVGAGGGDESVKTPPQLMRSSALQKLKVIATSGFLTALECTKFDFGRGSARTPLAELTAVLPRLPSWFEGP